MIGKIVSHYKIIEQLGEGGMGVVYKAEDTKLKRSVALKFLPPSFSLDEDAKKRFIHEAQAASALEHNNICNIHEINETEDGQIYIVMSCYEGETLKKKIEKGPLKIDEAIDIITQIVSGLQKAHEQGIVHRDIKPANIFITNDGIIKILDFGLAKVSGQTQLTQMGSTVGTVAYMSPEQTKAEIVDHRTDIWSLGVVIYEMITGKAPFKGDYEQAITYSIINEKPEPVTGLRTGVPMELERIVNKALTKNPSERYQHVVDLLVDLLALRKVLDINAKRITDTGSLEVPKQTKRKWMIIYGTLAAAVILLVMFYLFILPSEPENINRKSIAVLPFHNFSDDKSNEYFNDGITEDIITQLSKIRELRVISRTSSMYYKNTDKKLREIAEELGVSAILEGSVRRDGDNIRITAQLIDAESDEHLWAETYDREMTSIFALQSEVAQQIANTLKTTLTAAEKEQINKIPTKSPEAYDYFLQGRAYEMGREKEIVELQIELFEKAIELDPNFVGAYAHLAIAEALMYHLGYDKSKERLTKAKSIIEKAQKIDSSEPQVHRALGYYYYFGFREYAKALDEFYFAQKREPHNPENFKSIAFIQRRIGKFQECLNNLLIAFQYDPKSMHMATELGSTYETLRMYKEANEYYKIAISLQPDVAFNHSLLAWSTLGETGSIQKARKILEKASEKIDLDELWLDLVYFDIYEGKYNDALNRINFIRTDKFTDQDTYRLKSVLLGRIYSHMQLSDQAYTHFTKARKFFEEKVKECPDDPRLYSELGQVYAYLGLKNEAIEKGKKAVELFPISLDAYSGPIYLEALAEIYTITGEYDLAIDQLEYLLEIPSWISIGLLKAESHWDPLRNNPRFIKLIEGK